MNSSSVLKVSYQDDTRRVRVSGPLSYTSLLDLVQTSFCVQPPLTLTYVDDEEDTITVSSDVEVAEAINVAKSDGRPSLRFQVALAAEKSLVSHKSVRCDGCNMFPVVGNRFKCSVCQNFDFCENCESAGKHDSTHPFLKIRNPDQAPSGIMIVLNDAQNSEAPASAKCHKQGNKPAKQNHSCQARAEKLAQIAERLKRLSECVATMPEKKAKRIAAKKAKLERKMTKLNCPSHQSPVDSESKVAEETTLVVEASDPVPPPVLLLAVAKEDEVPPIPANILPPSDVDAPPPYVVPAVVVPVAVPDVVVPVAVPSVSADVPVVVEASVQPSVVPPPCQYSAQLDLLRGMGFSVTAETINLLESLHGDVQSVVERLCM